MKREAPCVNLNKEQATRMTTRIANLYLVSFFRILGLRRSANANTAGFVNRNICTHLVSSYSLSRNRENHVVERGLTQKPKSSSKTLKEVHNRKFCRATRISTCPSLVGCPTSSTTASSGLSSSSSSGRDRYRACGELNSCRISHAAYARALWVVKFGSMLFVSMWGP